MLSNLYQDIELQFFVIRASIKALKKSLPEDQLVAYEKSLQESIAYYLSQHSELPKDARQRIERLLP